MFLPATLKNGMKIITRTRVRLGAPTARHDHVYRQAPRLRGLSFVVLCSCTSRPQLTDDLLGAMFDDHAVEDGFDRLSILGR
jgi:hypothetical protein